MEGDDKLFAGAANHAVTFPVLEETFQELLTLCCENGWSEDEGLRIVFANGLAYLKNEREFSRWNGQAGDAEALRLAKYANEMNSMYAVMKFRAFNYRAAMQTLEFNVAGLRGLLAHTEATIERLRAENEQLKAELAKKS